MKRQANKEKKTRDEHDDHANVNEIGRRKRKKAHEGKQSGRRGMVRKRKGKKEVDSVY